MFNIITPELKELYKNSIDSLINQGGLAVPCSVIYDSLRKESCNNCFFDPIKNSSSGRYNNTGPAPFADFGICPICNGYGIIDMSDNETIYLSLIFDSKYWMNWGSKTVNISNIAAQSICNISLLPKILNCKEIVLDSSISTNLNRRYVRANDPQICGLGEHRYIITMWEK
jgi:hypothetical protein